MTNAIFLDLASILWLSDSLALRRSSPLLWRCCRFPLLRIFRRRRFPLLRIFRHRHLYRRLAMRLTLLLRQPATRPLARHQLHPEALHAPAGRLRLNQACVLASCSASLSREPGRRSRSAPRRVGHRAPRGLPGSKFSSSSTHASTIRYRLHESFKRPANRITKCKSDCGI